MGNGSAEREDNGRLSISVNALQGPAAPEEQTGVDRPTNSREKAPYDILQAAAFVIAKATREQPTLTGNARAPSVVLKIRCDS